MIFKEQITNWQEWGDIFQSIPAFMPLIEYIFRIENIPFERVENLTPGTNAVFKVGNFVIKIFAPEESGIDQTLDLQTELFSTKRAIKLGISTPKFIANGVVKDKYHFAYLITEHINGVELNAAINKMTDNEKFAVGRKLRDICDKMNTPCKPFNGIDVINDKGRYRRWDIYSESFKEERLAYIKSYNYGNNIFVHGDLCLDNILLTPDGELYIIDFADAVLAPVIYEHALLAYEFNFDSALTQGYFYDYSTNDFIDMCFNGLLIHDFGGDIVTAHFGEPNIFHTLNDLKMAMKQKIKSDNVSLLTGDNEYVII